MAAHRVEHLVGVGLVDDRNESAFARYVHRIEAEDLAGSADSVAHRYRLLVDDYFDARGFRQFVDNAGDTAARRIARASDRAAAGEHERNQSVKRSAVTDYSGVESESFARRYHGNPVISYRTAHHNGVSRTCTLWSQAKIGLNDTDAAGRNEQPVALATLDNFGVGCDDWHAGLARGVAHRIGELAQFSDRKSFFENEGGGERERLRANYCDVVDRAVYGERADVAAGESERAYHEGVGG